MTYSWPTVANGPDLDGLKQRTAELLPGVALIARREGLDQAPVEHYAGGSLPVFELAGGRVLKLYPQVYRNDFIVETSVLAHVAGRVRAPGVLATGELDGWSYLLMTKLPGVDLETAWPSLTEADRLDVAEQLGAWLVGLHALPATDLALPAPAPWPEFIRGRHAVATEEQRGRGLGSPWLEQVAPFLEKVTVAQDSSAHELAWLHTEMARHHAFVEKRRGRWVLSGVLDFEPAMRGAREYEFASVGIFTSVGDAPFLRRLLLAYGYGDADLDEALRLRFMAYTLLHRYSHLGWYLRRMPPAQGVDSLEALARQWWAW